MNLTTKINLILSATFLVALLLVGVNSYLLTADNARQQVTDQAELIMQAALAVRSYTVNELRPLLNQNDDGQNNRWQVSSADGAGLLRRHRPPTWCSQTRPNYSYTGKPYSIQPIRVTRRHAGGRTDHQPVHRRPGAGQSWSAAARKVNGVEIALHLLPDTHNQSQVPGLPQRTGKCRTCRDARHLRR